ncbi:MAG: hypothetical protein LCH39_09585 [Proteobacteria bacterium]|nr:hypothetical protein [Pseudomonadota bacterium]
MNFSVPFNWGAPEPEADKRASVIDQNDPELAAIVNAVVGLSKKEKSLVLVLIQTISAWGGLQDGLSKP